MMKSSLYPQISFLALLCLLTAVLQSSYSLPTTSDQHDTVQNSASESAREEKDKDQAPSSSSDGTSLVNVVIPAAYEVQVENIKSCEPTVTLSNGKKKDIASYITASYGSACLDSKLFLELSARGVLKKALARDDKKADTIICHEFVELLNAVEVRGLTKTMCAEGVLSQVSDEFCTTEEQTAEFKTHTEAVVGELMKRDLSQIATGFMLLGKIRGDDRCLHMCGGDDKVFCNAYVRLTEFFLEPSSKVPVSMIEQLLPPNQESDLDDIRTCSPYINLYEGKQDQISISSYVYIKNDKKECFDSNLNLAMGGTLNKPSKFLTKALDRDDKKSDTVLCREFIELFKLVDLTGLTQAMCRQRILMDISHVPFCSTPLPTEVDVKSLVEFFMIDNLFKIASTYQFLIGLHNSTGCERVCGEVDNVFCNAFVHLTLFFVEELKKDRQPPTASTRQATANTYNQYRSVIRKFKATLMSRRTTMKDLWDIQGSLDSPRLLNETLRRIFGMISDHTLVVIQNNLEIVRFMVRDVISHRQSRPKPDYPDTVATSITTNEVDRRWPVQVPTERGPTTRPTIKPRPYMQWGKDDTVDDEFLDSEMDAAYGNNMYLTSYKWQCPKWILVVLGLVIGTLYLCIRYKKRIRDVTSQYLGKFG